MVDQFLHFMIVDKNNQRYMAQVKAHEIGWLARHKSFETGEALVWIRAFNVDDPFTYEEECLSFVTEDSLESILDQLNAVKKMAQLALPSGETLFIDPAMHNKATESENGVRIETYNGYGDITVPGISLEGVRLAFAAVCTDRFAILNVAEGPFDEPQDMLLLIRSGDKLKVRGPKFLDEDDKYECEFIDRGGREYSLYGDGEALREVYEVLAKRAKAAHPPAIKPPAKNV